MPFLSTGLFPVQDNRAHMRTKMPREWLVSCWGEAEKADVCVGAGFGLCHKLATRNLVDPTSHGTQAGNAKYVREQGGMQGKEGQVWHNLWRQGKRSIFLKEHGPCTNVCLWLATLAYFEASTGP